METDPRRQPPAPPSPELQRTPVETPLVEYFRRRLEAAELELGAERERAREAQSHLRRQEELRGEVDGQLKSLLEQLRAEKSERESEEEKARARGRIEALEKRLDEMHSQWAAILKEALGRREADAEASSRSASAAEEGVRALSEGLALARQEIASLRDLLAAVPRSLSPEVGQVTARLEAGSRRLDEDSQRLVEEFRQAAQGLSGTVHERLSEMDRRLALELERQQERLGQLFRERTALQETLEEERHRLRQEMTQERLAVESRRQEELAALRDSVERLGGGQAEAAAASAALLELSRKAVELLSRPETAKDQVILDVEAEKRDLMKSLRERTEQLRAFTLERREVERTLGESLMELTRKLEAKDAEERSWQEKTAALELSLREAQGRLELAAKASGHDDERIFALAAERDELAKALMAEAQKVQTQIAARMEADSSWEASVRAAQEAVAAERDKRLAAEAQISDLRSQIQTLGEHVARLIHEKERAGGQQADWRQEKDGLLATLKKKEEMISMLSSTFQNLLKKPE